MELESGKAINSVSASESRGLAAKGKAAASSADKRLLRISNTLLILCVVIGLISLTVVYRKDAKVQQERLRLISSIQTMSGTLAGSPSAQVGDIVPSFETRSLEGNRSGISYDGRSKYLLYMFSPQCGACVDEFPTWDRIAPHARSRNYRVVGLSIYSENHEQQEEPEALDRSFEMATLPSNAIQRAYRVAAVPMVMLVSAEGKVEWVHYGRLPEEKLKELLSKIDGEKQSH